MSRVCDIYHFKHSMYKCTTVDAKRTIRTERVSILKSFVRVICDRSIILKTAEWISVIATNRTIIIRFQCMHRCTPWITEHYMVIVSPDRRASPSIESKFMKVFITYCEIIYLKRSVPPIILPPIIPE